jgi:chromosome segregation ATPase
VKNTGPLKLTALGLALLAIILAIVLVVRGKQAAATIADQQTQIITHSNNWVKANAELLEQKTVNTNLESDLVVRHVEINTLSNKLSDLQVELDTTIATSKAEIAKRDEVIASRDETIAKLEGHNVELEQKASKLTTTIGDLNSRIADLTGKLVAAEGDKAALTKELKVLLREKAELERRFTDITVLREQIKKIKRDLNVQRRLDRAAEGLPASSELKGSERMMNSLKPAPAKPRNYDLNVEVSTDGSLKVIPPIDTKPK